MDFPHNGLSILLRAFLDQRPSITRNDSVEFFFLDYFQIHEN